MNRNKKKKKTGITNYTLYKYGLYANQIVANMRNIDKSMVVGMYENLPIKMRKEIDLSSDDIKNVLNILPGPIYKTIYNDIEQKILNNQINNNKSNIITYIMNNYK